MHEAAGVDLDREVARLVFGTDPQRVPRFSSDDTIANLLLWKLAQTGISFKVRQLSGRTYCSLWGSGGRGVITASADSRALAICRAVRALDERLSPSSKPRDRDSVTRGRS